MTIFNKLKELDLGDNPTVFEIGCHHGYDTERLHKCLPHSKIYAFEADPRNAQVFKRNNFREEINFFELCISDKNGEEDFYLSSGLPPVFKNGTADEEIVKFCQTMEWTASSSTRKPTGHLDQTPWCEFNKKIKVKSLTLDTFCIEQNIKKIDFIWMDVQGAEDSIFRGAVNVLKSTKYIYTEYSNTELYEGQKNLKNIDLQLENFDFVETFESGGGTDALFKNKNTI